MKLLCVVQYGKGEPMGLVKNIVICALPLSFVACFMGEESSTNNVGEVVSSSSQARALVWNSTVSGFFGPVKRVEIRNSSHKRNAVYEFNSNGARTLSEIYSNDTVSFRTQTVWDGIRFVKETSFAASVPGGVLTSKVMTWTWSGDTLATSSKDTSGTYRQIHVKGMNIQSNSLNDKDPLAGWTDQWVLDSKGVWIGLRDSWSNNGVKETYTIDYKSIYNAKGQFVEMSGTGWCKVSDTIPCPKVKVLYSDFDAHNNAQKRVTFFESVVYDSVGSVIPDEKQSDTTIEMLSYTYW